MKIVILNTGCSNLLSVQFSIERLGYCAKITDNVNEIYNSDRIIFPGVGTVSAVMKNLNIKNLVGVIKKVTQPLLGICLGMQVLSMFSEESGGIKALGIIPTKVSLLKNKELVLPHVGWNSVDFNVENPLFKNLTVRDRFYFLHSYAIPINEYTIASTLYGLNFTSAIHYNNFFGVQFHPEKSGLSGHVLLKNFLHM